MTDTIVPDRTHLTATVTVDGTTNVYESIMIGSDEYLRAGDGEWTKLSGDGGDGPGGVIKEKITGKYTATFDTRNGRATRLLEKYIEIEDSAGLRFEREKIWIDGDGWITKEDHRSGFLNPEKLVLHTVVTYEYNPNDLKIEAPIK